MAAIYEALYSRLSGFAGLTALVGTRIYPNRAVQDAARPYVVFRRVTSRRHSSFGADDGVVEARFQVDVFDEDHASAQAVREQVRQALQRWSGTEASTVVQDTYFEGETDLYEDDRDLHHLADDYRVVYEE